jgi:hypothetical protein
LNVADTWDIMWLYCCWKFGFLTCAASVELIENIRFRLNVNHVIAPVSPLFSPGILAFPLSYPSLWQSPRNFDVYAMKAHRHLFWINRFSREFCKLMRIIYGQLGHG